MNASEEAVVDEMSELIHLRTGVLTPAHRRYLIRSALRNAAGDGPLKEGFQRLLRDGGQWAAMISGLTVGETYFFRHYGHYEVLGRLARQRRERRAACRVLCAGCATGEEAWSAAAVLARAYGSQRNQAEVLGWDIDGARIAKARRGRYRTWSVRHGLKGYDEFFVQREDTTAVGEDLRPITCFQTVNLAKTALPKAGLFDAIFFRNVAIYWTADRIAQVVKRLTDLLVEDGLLFVGPADPVQLGEGWRKQIDDEAILFSLRRVSDEEPRRLSSTKGKKRARSSTSKTLSKGAWAEIKKRPSPKHQPPRRRRRKDSASHTEENASSPKSNAVNRKKEEAAEDGAFEKLIAQAQAEADRGRYVEALSRLEELSVPLPVCARLLRGVILLNLGRVEEAVTLFKQCVFLEPRERAYRQWLAVAYEGLGRSEDAQREWRNVARLPESDEEGEPLSKTGTEI